LDVALKALPWCKITLAWCRRFWRGVDSFGVALKALPWC